MESYDEERFYGINFLPLQFLHLVLGLKFKPNK